MNTKGTGCCFFGARQGISGKLEYIGSTSIVLIETKGSRRISIATVLTEGIDIDTACKYPVDFQANARRICQCVNEHDALLAACEEARIALIAEHIVARQLYKICGTQQTPKTTNAIQKTINKLVAVIAAAKP